MPFLVTRNGVQRAIPDSAVPGYQAAGWTVGTYVAPEATSVDASGGLWIDPAAAQAQQQFTNDVSLATLGNQQRQTSISGYNAQTGAYDAQTGRFNAVTQLLGSAKNMGLVANVAAGDPNAAGLAVANSVGRLTGPIPGDMHTAGLETWQAKDMGDFAKSVLGSNKKTSTSAEQAASAPQTRQAGPQGALGAQVTHGGGAAPGPQGAAAPQGETLGWGPTSAGGSQPTRASYGNDRTLSLYYAGQDVPTQYSPTSAVTQDYLSRAQEGGANYDPAFAARVRGAALSAQPAAVGPFAFQRTAGDATRAMGDQRSWTPFASTVPMLAAGRVDRQGRPLVDTSAYGRSDISGEGDSDIRWVNKSHNLIESRGYGHGSDARNAAHKAAGMTGEQFDRIVKHGGDPFKVKKQAAGGTTSIKPPLFTAPSAGGAATDTGLFGSSLPTGAVGASAGAPVALPGPGAPLPPGDQAGSLGLPSNTSADMLNPHDPHQSPEHLMEIRAILQAPPDPHPSPIEQEVRACWRLDGAGHPVYQHVSGSMDAMTRDAEYPAEDAAPMEEPDPSMPAAGMPVPMAGGGTVVVRKPTLFSVGRQPFLVGEHGHDELVGLTASPDGGAVVHVDPLQNPRVPVSASDAAAANALVAGSPYHPMLRRMEGGGTASVSALPPTLGLADRYSAEWGLDDPIVLRALVMAESTGDPNAVGDNGNSIGLLQANMAGGRGQGYTADQLRDPDFNLRIAQAEITQAYQAGKAQGLGGRDLTRYVAVNAQRPDPTTYDRYSNWYDSLTSGQPVQSSAGDPTLQVQQPAQPAAVSGVGPVPAQPASGSVNPFRLAGGGTYSVGPPIAAAGTQLVPAARRFGKPSLFLSSTGQVQVPGAKAGKWTTQPFYAVQPFPDPTSALSSDVDRMTPIDQQALAALIQQKTGMDFSTWSALQQRARPFWQRPTQNVHYGR